MTCRLIFFQDDTLEQNDDEQHRTDLPVACYPV